MDYIIKTLHLLFYLLILFSPFINDCAIKLNVYIMLLFIWYHFISKYGKCGIINIEKIFLREHFKNGFFYKLIKPVIDYRKNIFFEKLYHLLLIYILILTIQIYQENCLNIIYINLIKSINKLTFKKV
jgi:hypothetical protein